MKNDETIGIFPIKNFFIAKKWRNLHESFKTMLGIFMVLDSGTLICAPFHRNKILEVIF